MSGASLALGNLRAFVILIVLAFHSSLAYVAYMPPSTFQFDAPPYQWRAFPILDSQRWFGFDLFCAYQDLSLISIMFFLSGLFVWPSLRRKGSRSFLCDRLLRLGVPFILVVGILMPIAHYPTYLVTATDPGIGAYWEHWLALPMWPSGPAWFLGPLLVLGAVAAGLYRVFPAVGDLLGRLVSTARPHPGRIFLGLATASALAYVPMALAFTPWVWFHHGPFAFQYCRPLHYAVYFFAGAGIGVYGIDRGLLAADGMLVRRWRAWFGAAAGTYVLWLGVTALTMSGAPSLALRIASALSFVVACAAGCFCALALFVRFASRPLPFFGSLEHSAYGMYLVHYVFVVWLQWALLPATLPAIAKAAIVFTITLLLSWGAILVMRRVPIVRQIVGADRAAAPRAS